MVMAMAKMGTSEAHRKAHDRFVLNMGLAIARGLVRCFLGTLSASKVTSLSDGREPTRVWECDVLGGIVTNLEEEKHVLGIRQAGALWLVDSAGNAQQIDVHGMGTGRTSAIRTSRLQQDSQSGC